jgi:dihydrofolate synthase/folylpolyglutamate synthase
MRKFQIPHAPAVHIAGSNGKGTTAWRVARCLEENGYRVGLYTSPHLNTFRERIEINGKMISEEEVVYYLTELPNPEHFFERATCMALRYFHDKRVDWIVMETGIGGRDDPTNVVMPEVAAITSLSLEHTDLLGSTLEEIAYAKAGIIKPGAATVIGGDIPRELLAPYLIGPTYYAGENIAATIIEVLGMKKTPGLLTFPPCRFEAVENTILDVAHNPASLQRLAQTIQKRFPGQKAEIVLSLSQSRSPSVCAEALAPIARHFHLVPSPYERALSTAEIAREIPFPSTSYETIDEGFARARRGKFVVATGSFYHLGRIRNILGVSDLKDPCDFVSKTV